jgi:isocitrate/isopropylmalate dehydrogenase
LTNSRQFSLQLNQENHKNMAAVESPITPESGAVASPGFSDNQSQYSKRPIYGSAFSITGKGVANSVAILWTAAEMLTWLGEEEAAGQLMECVENFCKRGHCYKGFGWNGDDKKCD